MIAYISVCPKGVDFDSVVGNIADLVTFQKSLIDQIKALENQIASDPKIRGGATPIGGSAVPSPVAALAALKTQLAQVNSDILYRSKGCKF